MKVFRNLLLIGLSGTTFSAFSAQTAFICSAQTKNGAQTVDISGCVENLDEANGMSEQSDFANCPGEKSEFVTIQRETSVARMTPPMSETIKIPGRLFELHWVEDGFSFSLNEKKIGSLNFSIVAGESGKLNLNFPGMKHSFKAVECKFN